MNDKLLILIVITGILVVQNFIALVVFSFEAGRDYIITGNKGKRLNVFEKLYDGFTYCKSMKI